MNEFVNPEHIICFNCEHYLVGGTCLAFPDGIPVEIWKGQNRHEEPLKEQENDLTFEEAVDEITED